MSAATIGGPRLRWLVILVCAVLAAAVIMIGNTAPAAADDCKPSSVPDHAGSGLPGLIDNKTTSKHPSTKYGNYGWSGLKWTTCDLDKNKVGVPTTDSAVAVLDTSVGNAGLGFGAVLGAIMTQLHQWATNPVDILGPIDDLLSDITKAVTAATWTHWVGVFMLLAAVGVILNALRREVRKAATTVAAVLLACLAVAWFTTPVTKATGGQPVCVAGKCTKPTKKIPGAVYAATMFDGVARGIVGGVDKSVTKVSGKPSKGESADEARGAMMQDQILLKIWERGELGSDQSAKKYGDDLYRYGTSRWTDKNVNPDSKRDDYNTKAQAIKKTDPEAYDTIRGIKGGRTGYGFLAVVIMGSIALIRIPAELLMIAGLLVMRVLVMFGPVLALCAIVPAFRPVAGAAVKVGLASIVNVAIYGVIASIHTVMVGAIATNSTNLAVSTILIIALTMVVWLVAKPFRSVTRLATGQQAADALTGAADAPGNALRTILGAAAGMASKIPKPNDEYIIEGQPLPLPAPGPINDGPEGGGQERTTTVEGQSQPLPLPAPTRENPSPPPSDSGERVWVGDIRAPGQETAPVPDQPALPPSPDDGVPVEARPIGGPPLVPERGPDELATESPTSDDRLTVPVEWDLSETRPDVPSQTVPVEWETLPPSIPAGAAESIEPQNGSGADDGYGPPLPGEGAESDDGDVFVPPLVIDSHGETVTVNDQIVRNLTIVDQIEGEPVRITSLPAYEPELDATGNRLPPVFNPESEPDRARELTDRDDLVGAGRP